MQRALHMVTHSQEPVKSIASQVGYRSAAAFTRAFARRFGRGPDQARREAKDAAPSA
jgi:transcriptional regulator GlxA family with amidase domain